MSETGPIILACTLVFISVALGIHFFLSEHFRKRKLLKYKKFIQTADAERRAKDILRVLSTDWIRFKSAQSMLQKTIWTDQELLEGLENVFTEATEEDTKKRRSGRNSNYFEFYDCGLASHCEALRDRLGLPQPWSKSPHFI